MKKHARRALCVLALVTLVAGCGKAKEDAGQPSTTTGAAAVSAGPTTSTSPPATTTTPTTTATTVAPTTTTTRAPTSTAPPLPTGAKPGDPDQVIATFARIAGESECTTLQDEFDTASANHDRDSAAGAARSSFAQLDIRYMQAADKQLKAAGCY